jgi:osmotically-inducible protein OsmY
MAVLVGLVDTKEQWKRAKKIAINVGAKKVKNYILLVQKK